MSVRVSGIGLGKFRDLGFALMPHGAVASVRRCGCWVWDSVKPKL